jgi:predicted permease
VTADWRVVAFTVGVSLLTGVLFGLFPALQTSRTDLSLTLKESGGRTGTSFRQNRSRAVLVVVEVALALVLLVGSALLIRSFVALRAVNPGYATHNILTMRMSLNLPRFTKTAAIAQLAREGRERLRAVPGVEAASSTCCIPLEGGYGLPFIIVGRPLDGPSHGGGGWQTISPGFFEVYGIPVLRGRSFDERDESGAPEVAIINQAMARRYWPNGEPLADRLIIGRGVGPEFDEPPRQIIGVVGDVRDGGLNRDPQPTMYVPYAQVPDAVNALNVRLTPIAWVLRTRGEPHGVSATAQKELRAVSGGLPVARVRSMDEVVVQSTARQDFNMLLLTVFAVSALLLAAIGVYGLMAYSVQQRTQEIGIRRALGAESSRVRNMVVAQGMRLALAGVGVGLAGAFGLSRVVASLLFGVTARDPLTFVGVAVLLSLVAFVAVWFPALRAGRVDPIVALRFD